MTRYYEAHNGTSATIIEFPRAKPRGRGRPKSDRPKTDTGTPELVMKRAHGETAETLDLMLERGMIGKEQHWCGIHLRWLYTLRFGAPSIRTIDLTHTHGGEITQDDPKWRELREAEFNEAIKLLTKGGHAALLLDICVHNKRPRFLTPKKPTTRYSAHSIDTLIKLKTGLDILVALWGRGR